MLGPEFECGTGSASSLPRSQLVHVHYISSYTHRDDLPPHYPSFLARQTPSANSSSLSSFRFSLQGRKRRATNTIKSASFRSVCGSCIWLSKPPIHRPLASLRYSAFLSFPFLPRAQRRDFVTLLRFLSSYHLYSRSYRSYRDYADGEKRKLKISIIVCMKCTCR